MPFCDLLTGYEMSIVNGTGHFHIHEGSLNDLTRAVAKDRRGLWESRWADIPALPQESLNS